MLRADLAEAGIDYQVESGRYFDFHALRGETASLLAASRTHPKTAQSMMRRMDMNLTMSDLLYFSPLVSDILLQ